MKTINVVPTEATRRLAQRMILAAEETTGADAALAHLRDVHPDQLMALVGVLLTATKQHRKPGRAQLPLQLTEEARMRGYSQYRQGIRTEFAVTAYREYQRVNQRARRQRAGLRAAS